MTVGWSRCLTLSTLEVANEYPEASKAKACNSNLHQANSNGSWIGTIWIHLDVDESNLLYNIVCFCGVMFSGQMTKTMSMRMQERMSKTTLPAVASA